MKWIEKWQKYAYFDLLDSSSQKETITPEERIHPGKIDNSDIILDFPKNTLLIEISKNHIWQNV
jgi:hypothetical protein